jgi:hypothetical protein
LKESNKPAGKAERRMDENGNPYMHVPIQEKKSGMRLHRDLIHKRSPLQQMYEPWSPSDLKPEIPRHHILNKEFELHKKTQKPLLGTTKADVTLELYDNQMWTGEFLMGGDQVVDLVYDTGSAWLVVTSITCENCLGTNYDHSLAPNFKQLTTDKSSLTYGSAHIEGYTAVDDAKISKDMGLKNFPFFDVVA